MSAKTTNSKSTTSAAKATTQKGNTLMDQKINNFKPELHTVIIHEFVAPTSEDPTPEYVYINKDNEWATFKEKQDDGTYLVKTTDCIQVLTIDADGIYYMLRINPTKQTEHTAKFGKKAQEQTKQINPLNNFTAILKYQINHPELDKLIGEAALQFVTDNSLTFTITSAQYKGNTYYTLQDTKASDDLTAKLLPEDK